MATPAPPGAVTILDHLDGITVPGNVFDQPTNEYWALVCLHQGMEFLHSQALKIEHVAKQRMNPSGNLRVFHMGTLPDIPEVPRALLTCAFHWYAISACQYVRTVGAIAFRQDCTRPDPGAYVEKVIPEVKVFRDKVAAHFAGMTKNKHDNEAERLASLLPPLTFEDDSWYVGGMTVGLSGGGKVSTSEAIKPWSLCRVHEELRKRYWPPWGLPLAALHAAP
jgi:hypothetical protein